MINLIKKSNESVYYIAYGSNLNYENISSWCQNAEIIGKSILHGYKLAFKGSADRYSYLTLEHDENEAVPIGIYKLKQSDIKMLDKYESFPELYSKEYLDVLVDGKKIKVLVYVMNKKFDYHIPNDMYFQTCVDGYEDFGFDVKYLEDALEESKAYKKRR